MPRNYVPQKPHTICWTCKNGYAHKCKWISRGDEIPGWEIVPTSHRFSKINDNGKRVFYTLPSARVVKCPNYLK